MSATGGTTITFGVGWGGVGNMPRGDGTISSIGGSDTGTTFWTSSAAGAIAC